MGNVELLKNLYAAFGRGDVETVLGAMSPDIHWYEAEGNPFMPSGEAIVGPGEIVNKLFARIATECDGFTVHTGTFTDAGDRVIMEGRYSGIWKATGKSMAAQVCHIWDVKDGKVTKFQQYVDTGRLQDAMGAR